MPRKENCFKSMLVKEAKLFFESQHALLQVHAIRKRLSCIFGKPCDHVDTMPTNNGWQRCICSTKESSDKGAR